MSKKYDVVATIGSYMAGNEKKYITRNVGAVIETQHGLSITLDACFNPAGCQVSEDGKVWLKLFEPREKDAAQKAYSQGVKQNNSTTNQRQSFDNSAMEDDIPW